MEFELKRLLLIHNIGTFDEVNTNYQSEYSPQELKYTRTHLDTKKIERIVSQSPFMY